ncbi:hypothetical protein VRU48_14850 [Pedobacter sp. KR3-3]|uniref:DUF3989 domain-containing protein n=1 Tax=Pedobacter albus TaxID=3113905 RepID=A0ABU7IA86_9SPHI|nr:hypothetical protein [Pedobacter sp. KR3-3]MEE1946400.1 hypothetical protein [Pedobacter sp. KR3-3]
MKLTGTNKGGPGSVRNLLAHHIATGIVRRQRRIAAWLQARERKASLKQKKILLVIFCLLAGAYLIYVLADAIFSAGYHSAPAVLPKGNGPPLLLEHPPDNGSHP